MAMCRHSTILGRKSLSALLYLGESGHRIHAQHAFDAVSHLAASPCSVLHSSSGHLASSLVNGPAQHQQYRSKVTNKSTTKSQRDRIHIPVKREAEISQEDDDAMHHLEQAESIQARMSCRKWWTEVRGVHDAVCLHRLANFARVYPRYRNLPWLDVIMPQWDSAIERLIAHDMGMFPANQLARKHPFILNARIEPLQWAKMAVRGRLPAYEWTGVLNDIKQNTGAGRDLMRTTAAGKVAIDTVNETWRSPNKPKAAAVDAAKHDEVEVSEEEKEAWLETVSASAALSEKGSDAAGRQLQDRST